MKTLHHSLARKGLLDHRAYIELELDHAVTARDPKDHRVLLVLPLGHPVLKEIQALKEETENLVPLAHQDRLVRPEMTAIMANPEIKADPVLMENSVPKEPLVLRAVLEIRKYTCLL